MSAPEQGERIHGGQRYELVGRVPHTCRDGRQTELLVWRGECARCGAPFEFGTPAGAAKFSPNRRCQRHKRPGGRVAHQVPR
jgi:hypothetical protein